VRDSVRKVSGWVCVMDRASLVLAESVKWT